MTYRLRRAIQGKSCRMHTVYKPLAPGKGSEISWRKIYNLGAGRKVAEDLRNRALNHDSEYILVLDMLYKYIKECRKYGGNPNAEHVGELMHKHGWEVKDVDLSWIKAWAEKQTREVDWAIINGLSSPIEIVVYKGPNKQEIEEKKQKILKILRARCVEKGWA